MISRESGANSIGHNFAQLVMPRADGVKSTVAYSSFSTASTKTWSVSELGANTARFDSLAWFILQFEGDMSSVKRWWTRP